ncbi:hypothetical protein LPJ53_005698 [Coemansia erecta]|uniref:Uncharacterized protein n=1 Tax=Coemansia erecta TaxID=147472 RepID=A0A9W7XV49_9FUNG|nr:hypothetical protein LPJ53_005698 [Coemansia erecta]
MLGEAKDTGDKEHSNSDSTRQHASDECDQLSELHGAELQSKSPAILSPALTDSSGSGGATSRPLDRHEAYAVTKAAVEAAERQAEAITEQKEAAQGDAAVTETTEPAADSADSADPSDGSKTITLKQLYGMLCWLQVGDNRSLWLADPLGGCQRAITCCPHLAEASAEMLNAVMGELNTRRLRIVERHGSADDVPKDERMFEGGPLFVIFNHAVAGRLAEVGAALRANATGAGQAQAQSQPQAQRQQSPVRSGIRGLMDSPAFGGPVGSSSSSSPAAAGGPARHRRTMLPAEHPFMQRARRLTPAEVRQMRDELAVRREIGIRDAVLLADWVALRRRELELKERQLREIARDAQRDSSVEAIARLDEFMRRMHEEM